MADKNGNKTGGRKPGSPNKSTKAAREAIARFVDGNCDRLQAWLDEIHEKDGAQAAFKCFADLLEYHVPKLSRSEHTGADGKDLNMQAVVVLPAKNGEA